MMLMAGMPQLVPFYYMNEVVGISIGMPIAIYIISKYVLPHTVRQRMARLFVSKL